MKKLIFGVLAILAFPTPAHADTCADLGKVAAAVMKLRQAEVPYSKVREVTEKYRYTAPATYRLVNRMAEDAYEQPAYMTPEFKQRQIDSFRNKWEVLCYKSTDDEFKTDDEENFIGS